MVRITGLLASISIAASLGMGCGDDGGSGTPDAGALDGGNPDASVQDPTDQALYEAPDGEKLAFGVREGLFRNYFHRQGPAAVHLLTRSGTEPRIVAAFPAGNQGIGVWFDDAGDDTALWIGDTDDADLIAAGGGVEAVVRKQDGAKDMHGVRATVKSNASTLSAYLTVLANVRTVRDFGYGRCLESQTKYPELRNETIELIAAHNVVRVRRVQIGGEYSMELLIKGAGGTTVTVKDEDVALRDVNDCEGVSGEGTGKVIEISGTGGVELEIIALSDDEPLTPIEKADLLTETPAEDSFELDALAFLSYREKLQAGSWRFLTYFGRDTLLSVRMLMPSLKLDIIEAAMTSVMERINLTAGVQDPHFDYIIEVGDVAHEEELADFAAWLNDMAEPKPEDVRQPRYDYKMIDDDFLLAPVVVEYIEKVAEETEDPEEADAIIEAFLAQTRTDGKTFQEALEANLALVLDRARPYSEEQIVSNLVELKNTVPVGQWRDSSQGIAYGRYAFDVNVALVPAALAAAQTLYTRLDNAEKATEAGDIAAAWEGVDQLFLVDEPIADIRTNVQSYAEAVGVTDTSAQLEAENGNRYRFYAIALDANGDKLPIMHTDHGFVLELTEPSDAYLQRMARTITRTFPAGLMSDVGVMVANPALAPEDFEVTDPKDLADETDDEVVNLRDKFTNSDYHGAVVWSWQQALLASGVARQLERGDLDPQTRTALEQAECALWKTINNAEEVRAGELWSWEASESGELEYRSFGYNLSDVDESNAAQLWSTVYLAVKPPADFDTRCISILR